MRVLVVEPILMVTAAGRLDDKASGSGLGADDYLTKPFHLRITVSAPRKRLGEPRVIDAAPGIGYGGGDGG